MRVCRGLSWSPHVVAKRDELQDVLDRVNGLLNQADNHNLQCNQPIFKIAQIKSLAEKPWLSHVGHFIQIMNSKIGLQKAKNRLKFFKDMDKEQTCFLKISST